MRTMLSGVAVTLAAVVGQTTLADSYAVKFVASGNPENRGQYRVAEVQASLTPNQGIVGLFRNHEDVGLLNGWVTFLHDPHALDGDGKEVRLTFLTAGRFRVEGWVSGPVTLKYRVLLQHDRFPNDPGDDELAYARPYGVFWTGRALMMEGAPAADVEVRFDAPADWRITTPWVRADEGGRRFIAKTTDDLLDSAFMAGTHVERTLQVAGGEARLALGPPLADQEAVLLSTLERSLWAYERMFGAGMTGRLLVIAAEASFSGGGVMGRSISILIGPDRGDTTNQGEYIIAHEAFHVWNSQWRKNETDGELQWVGEGSAEYYANLIRVRAGLTNEHQFIAELGRRAGLYLTALRKASIAGGGSTKLTGGENSYNIVYSGGMMADLALDATIREKSRGRQSLDDAMRALHARYTGPGGEIATLNDLKTVLTQRYGVADDFIARYIIEREPLPLKTLLTGYGLDMTVEDASGVVKVTVSKSPAATATQKAAWARLIRVPEFQPSSPRQPDTPTPAHFMTGDRRDGFRGATIGELKRLEDLRAGQPTPKPQAPAAPEN